MKTTLLILFLTIFTFSAYSQLINIEKRRKTGKKPLQGKISLALDLKENTKQILQAKNSIALQYNKNATTILLFNDISFMRLKDNDKEDLINKGFQHFRYNYTFDYQKRALFTIEAFAQHQYNMVKLLETRFISGGGARFKIWGNDSSMFYFYIAPLVMYEYEKLKEDKSLSEENNGITKKFKGDFYISFGLDINKIFGIGHTTYYQPYFKDFSDYRVASDTSVNFKITNKLVFSIIFSLNYDAKPPATIPYLFYSLRNSISYSF